MCRQTEPLRFYAPPSFLYIMMLMIDGREIQYALDLSLTWEVQFKMPIFHAMPMRLYFTFIIFMHVSSHTYFFFEWHKHFKFDVFIYKYIYISEEEKGRVLFVISMMPAFGFDVPNLVCFLPPLHFFFPLLFPHHIILISGCCSKHAGTVCRRSRAVAVKKPSNFCRKEARGNQV